MPTIKTKELASLDDIQASFLQMNAMPLRLSSIVFSKHKPFMGTVVLMCPPKIHMLKPNPPK